MCLAIPGKIVEIVDPENHIAKVEVGGVKRNINIGMLGKDEAGVGDYVLIHVGFAMSKVDEHEANVRRADVAAVERAPDLADEPCRRRRGRNGVASLRVRGTGDCKPREHERRGDE